VLLKPAVMVLSYAIMRASGLPVPPPHFSLATIALVFVAFFVFGIGEELGWSGYAIDRLQRHRSALRAALIIGVIWAAWHLVPLVQAHRAPEWITWWCAGTVATRVIYVWIYNNTNRSVFSAILFHDIDNLCWLTFPVGGSYFDPRVTSPILVCVAVTVIVVSGRHLSKRTSEID
jgi:membrane protease YdiL (CAAX protease family)